jgi:hypothetical protein
LEKDFCALEALGESVNTPFLVPTLIQKFPVFIREKVSDLCEGNLQIPKICKALEKITGNMEMASNFLHVEGDTSRKDSAGSDSIVFFTQDKRKKCVYCENDQHFSDQCKTYDTIENRLSKLKGKCHICLNSNHSTDQCRYKDRKCKFCDEKTAHHRSLCSSRNKRGKKTEKVTDSVRLNSQQDATAHDSTSSAINMISLSCLAYGKETFMSTLLVKAGYNNKYVTVRLFLDTGCS